MSAGLQLGNVHLPSQWQSMKLKYIAKLQSGTGITADTIDETGPYAVYGGNGIRGYTTDFTHEGKHILIGRQGALCGNINYADGQFWASEHAVVVELQGEHDVLWLGELLRSMNLNQHSQSAAQPGLAVEVIANLEIPVPPYAHQRAIADFLDAETARIDELIATKESLLAILVEKRRALVSQAVTRGINPDVKMRDSGIPRLGEIPARWEKKKLKYVASLKSGSGITSESIDETGPYAVYGGNGIRGYTTDFTHEGKHVLIGRQGALCGNINYAEGQFWASEHAVVVELLDDHEVFWLGELLRSMNLNQYSQAAAQPGLAVEFISNLVIPVPPIDDQKEIVDFINREQQQIDGMSSAVEKSLVLLRERREAIIAAAVTGQLDVGVA